MKLLHFDSSENRCSRNLQGQQILKGESKNQRIDIPVTLSSGMYVLTTHHAGEQSKTHKILIN